MDSTLRSLSRLIAGLAIAGLIAMIALPAMAQQGIAVERLPVLESPTSLVQSGPSTSAKPSQAVQKKKTDKAAVAKKPAAKAQPAKTASATKKPAKKPPVKATVAKKKAQPAGVTRT